MSRIDELIADLCPGGVEFKEIQELFVTKNGYTPSTTNKAFWTDGTVPWFRMEDIRESGRILSESRQQVTEEAVKGGRLFPANSIIVATSATIGEHALITVPHLSNQRFMSLALKPEFSKHIDMKFIFYCCFVLDEWCRNNATTSSFASVDMNGFKRFRFPIPPLEVQREIVKVLDTFTRLEAELEAELEARRRQYQYYRDALLSFAPRMRGAGMSRIDELITELCPSGVAFKELGEIGLIFGGLSGKSKADFVDGNARFVSYVNVFNNIAVDVEAPDFVRVDPSERQRRLQRGDILFTGSSETPQEVAMSSVVTEDVNAPLFLNSFCIGYRLHDQNALDPEFAKHLFRSRDVRKQLVRTASGVTRFNVSKERLAKVVIPLPPLEEQARIASILDKFDALVNDLSVGLPAELAARRKQYEHYRDRLLTFREAT